LRYRRARVRIGDRSALHGQDWLILTSPDGRPTLAFKKVGELPEATWPDGPVPHGALE
jgi:hypothetical protein